MLFIFKPQKGHFLSMGVAITPLPKGILPPRIAGSHFNDMQLLLSNEVSYFYDVSRKRILVQSYWENGQKGV